MKKSNSSDNIRNVQKETKVKRPQRQNNRMLLSMIRKMKKEQKETNKKLNLIINLLMKKKELYIEHFEIAINSAEKKKSNKELFDYFDIKPQKKLNKSANESKLKIEECLNSNINLDKYKIEQPKKEEIEVININKEITEVSKQTNINNDTSSEASIDRIFCISENKTQINSSQSDISSLQSSSSNVAKSTQERFKKVRGFNFKNNIKTKKIKDIDRQLTKEGKKGIFDLQKFFLKPKEK